MNGTRTSRTAAAALVSLLAVTAGAARPAAAQPPDRRVWTAVSIQGRVGAGDRWRWASDAFVRAKDGAGTLDQVAGRGLITLNASEHFQTGIGYAWGEAFQGDGLSEHRIFQQYLWSSNGAVRVSLRGRLEERFLSGEDTTRLRARQQVRIVAPLPASRRLRGVVAEELFVQTNHTNRTSPGFESARTFVGVLHRVTPRTAAEIGYLHLYSAVGPVRHSHVLSVTVGVSL
jgi:hypothetical protein